MRIIFFAVFVLVVLGVIIYFIQFSRHESRIYGHIKSRGGRIISIERRGVFTGPFAYREKGTSVYRIEYQLGKDVKEGWVKFGGLFGPDWRL